MSISLSRLMNPGVPLAEEKVEPVGESDQPALYAFPFKISLAPGQSKTITLKSLRAVETVDDTYVANRTRLMRLLRHTDAPAQGSTP